MAKVHAAGSGTAWDDGRNTSQVRQVPPQAIEAARRSRERYHRERPAWFVWIEQGCPPETPTEYAANGGLHVPSKRRGRR